MDLWWTLLAGDHLRATGDVPRTALWTVEAVRDEPWVCHGWLAAWAYSAVADAFGLDAVPIVPTLCGLAVLALLAALGRRLGASWLVSLLVADVLLYVVLLRMINRAEAFAYVAFAAVLFLVIGFARDGRIRHLAGIAAAALVWINAHASFLLLLALLPLAAAGLALDVWRRGGFRPAALPSALASRGALGLAATALVVAALVPLNPYGLDLLRSVLDPLRADSVVGVIDEWQPVYAAGFPPPRFWVPAALALAALGLGFRRLSFASILVVLGAGALAVSASRHVSFFAIAVVFLLADFAAGFAPGRRARRALAFGLVAALAAGNAYAVASLGLGGRRLSEHPSPFVTARGLAYVRENVRGDVLNSIHLGGLLAYFGRPGLRVAIDPRGQPFPADYLQSYRNALYGPPRATRAFVDRHGIEHVILDAGMFAAYFQQRLPALPDFAIAWADERIVVLSRREALRR